MYPHASLSLSLALSLYIYIYISNRRLILQNIDMYTVMIWKWPLSHQIKVDKVQMSSKTTPEKGFCWVGVESFYINRNNFYQTFLLTVFLEMSKSFVNLRFFYKLGGFYLYQCFVLFSSFRKPMEVPMKECKFVNFQGGVQSDLVVPLTANNQSFKYHIWS